MIAVWIVRTLNLLPRRLHTALDAWSQAVAVRRRAERLQRSRAKTAPLPPVVQGRVTLPHPWGA